MANEAGINELVKELKASKPARFYLLHGSEDYLREYFFSELRGAVLGEGQDDFNHRRFDYSEITLGDLKESVETLPFLSEMTLVEVRGFDFTKGKEKNSDDLRELIRNIPDYCTLTLIMDGDEEPDGRLALTKTMREIGRVIKFTPQELRQLVRWLQRRFTSLGKEIGPSECDYLIFCAGHLMTGLISETEKIANYSEEKRIIRAHIDATVEKLPEARIFDLTDKISEGDYDGALKALSELLYMKESPIMLLSMMGTQLIRLYTAKFSRENGLGRNFVAEVCEIKHNFILDKLEKAAKNFSLEGLRRCLEACAESDKAMKSSGLDNGEILCDLVLKLSVEGMK